MDLGAESANFAADIQSTLRLVLPTRVVLTSQGSEGAQRFVVRPEGEASRERRVALLVGGEHLADLSVAFFLESDSSGSYLKAVRSDLGLHSTLDRTPLLRLEHRSDMRSDPVAHWQVHAERGAFSHLLARAHLQRPTMVSRFHDLSSLHLPVGGERFRPCLEDFLHFLVHDCGVDANVGWEKVVAEGRATWRRRQVAASVRDAPATAARVLGELGWQVAPPEDPKRDDDDVLTRW